jgi:hypothetical protein
MQEKTSYLIYDLSSLNFYDFIKFGVSFHYDIKLDFKQAIGNNYRQFIVKLISIDCQNDNNIMIVFPDGFDSSMTLVKLNLKSILDDANFVDKYINNPNVNNNNINRQDIIDTYRDILNKKAPINDVNKDFLSNNKERINIIEESIDNFDCPRKLEKIIQEPACFTPLSVGNTILINDYINPDVLHIRIIFPDTFGYNLNNKKSINISFSYKIKSN